MPIDLACECGWKKPVKDEYAGKRAKCPSCSTVLTVPNPTLLEDAAAAILMEMEPTPPPRPAAVVRPPEPPPKDFDPERTRGVYRIPAEPEPLRPPVLPKPKKPTRRKTERREERRSGISISPGVLSGLGMIVLGAVWLVVGLAAGWIFFYPPILIVLGFVRLVSSLMGREE